tara:strand:+ start:1875 stop:2090 length:216 start_codon:yes stop_codon:yes gene_type:complete
MKFILVIWVCSFVEGNGCLPPLENKKLYDSWYACSVAAHKESISLLQKMGYANVNKYQIGAKYYCKPTQVL